MQSAPCCNGHSHVTLPAGLSIRFINFSDNANLDGMDFSPFAKVTEGMEVVDRIFKIGEKPDQGRIQAEGNKYLKKDFPRLTWIKSATLVGADGKEL